jgi:hypothetical protein
MRICLIVVIVAIVVARVKAIIKPINARCTAFMPSSVAAPCTAEFRHPANPAHAPGHSMPAPCAKIAASRASHRHAPQAECNFPRFPERDLIASSLPPSQRNRLRNRVLHELNVAGTRFVRAPLSFWRPLARRGYPFVDVRGGFGLACFLHQQITPSSLGKLLRFLARPVCRPVQAFAKGYGVLVPMPCGCHEPLPAGGSPQYRAIGFRSLT